MKGITPSIQHVGLIDRLIGEAPTWEFTLDMLITILETGICGLMFFTMGVGVFSTT
jgi:hypothetical protein